MSDWPSDGDAHRYINEIFGPAVAIYQSLAPIREGDVSTVYPGFYEQTIGQANRTLRKALSELTADELQRMPKAVAVAIREIAGIARQAEHECIGFGDVCLFYARQPALEIAGEAGWKAIKSQRPSSLDRTVEYLEQLDDGTSYHAACDEAGIEEQRRFPQCFRFPPQARYGAVNHPDLSDEAVICMIGLDIKNHLKREGGRILGKTWQERLPAYVSYLEERGITPEEAVRRHEEWNREQLARMEHVEHVANVPLMPGSNAMVEVVRPLPFGIDLLSGKAKRSDLPAPTNEVRPGEPSDRDEEADAEPVNWPPDDDWHFREGLGAYLGVTFPIHGIPARLIDALFKARFPCGESTLIDATETAGGKGTLKSHLTKCRKILREAFRLSSNDDPIPSKGRGADVTWRIDRHLLKQSVESSNGDSMES